MVYLWRANVWRLNLAAPWRGVFERSKMFENGEAVIPSALETETSVSKNHKCTGLLATSFAIHNL
jgi:hypothetical protein